MRKSYAHGFKGNGYILILKWVSGITFYSLNIVLGWVLWEAESEMECVCRASKTVSLWDQYCEREGKEAGLGRGRRPAAMQVCHPQLNSREVQS